MAGLDEAGTVVSPHKVQPCTFCGERRVVLAAQADHGQLVFFCRRCCVECEVKGTDGIVRDPTDWPDLVDRPDEDMN